MKTENWERGVHSYICVHRQNTFFLLQCIEYLLQNGASVDDCHSKNGGNLLHFAIEHCLKSMEVDKVSCLNILLQSSLAHKVDQMDHSGRLLIIKLGSSPSHFSVA